MVMAGTTIQDGAAGRRLPAGADGSDLPAGQGWRVCRGCRYANPPVARYCAQCGAELSDEGSDDAAGRTAGAARGGPVDVAQGRPFDVAQGGPSAAGAERMASQIARGDELAAEGRWMFDDARRAYLAAARAAPSSAEPLLALGRLCRTCGRRALAKSYYRQAARRDAACWQAWAEGSDCCGLVQDFRRTWWLANALRAALRACRTEPSGGARPNEPPGRIDPQVWARFLSHYGKLRWWERWLIRSLTGQPG